METIFYKIFLDKITINDNDLKYIVQSSSGNISVLNIIVNYLRQEEIIVKNSDDSWTCNSISRGSLSNILDKYIRQRYDRLDEYLKRTLQQSSLLGKEFNVKQLQDSFSILQADEWLSNIERISHLIKHNEHGKYKDPYIFENDEVFIYIKKQILSSFQKTWYQILIDYYILEYQKLEESNKYTKNILTDQITISIKIASYCSENEQYNRSLDYYVQAITHCFTTMNYKQASSLISTAKKIAIFSKADDYLIYQLDRMDAECYEYLGFYSTAKKHYQSCIDNYDHQLLNYNLEFLEYKVAFCTYYSSRVHEAFNLAYNLRKN